jgi:hypothetical protein
MDLEEPTKMSEEHDTPQYTTSYVVDKIKLQFDAATNILVASDNESSAVLLECKVKRVPIICWNLAEILFKSPEFDIEDVFLDIFKDSGAGYEDKIGTLFALICNPMSARMEDRRLRYEYNKRTNKDWTGSTCKYD